MTRCDQTRDHASMDLATRFSLQLWLATAVLTDQPWSPIVGGSTLFPPLVSSPNLLVHSGPLYRGHSEVPHLPHLSLPSFYDKKQHNRRVTARRRPPYYRRNYRRRRRYFRDPKSRSRLRYVRSHYLPAEEELQGRARAARQEDEGRSFVRSFRNLFGAPEHCLEKGRQYSCTFAPVCWVTGGVATPGNTTDQHNNWDVIVTALDQATDIDNATLMVSLYQVTVKLTLQYHGVRPSSTTTARPGQARLGFTHFNFNCSFSSISSL